MDRMSDLYMFVNGRIILYGYNAQEHEAEHLGIAECVDFYVNAPYAEVRQLLGGAVAGLHTMVDEHFGISIVEYMAAGLYAVRASLHRAPSFDCATMLYTCRCMVLQGLCLLQTTLAAPKWTSSWRIQRHLVLRTQGVWDIFVAQKRIMRRP